MPTTTLLTKKGLSGVLPLIILALLPVITYYNTLSNDFVFDDRALIEGSTALPSLQDPDKIITVLTQKKGYRPVRTLSYALDYYFSGTDPFSYHLSNIVYHSMTTILVYLVTCSLLSNRITAFIAALIFAVHPVHTDSVTYLAGRRDILCGLFYLMGFYLFLAYRRTGRLLLLPLSLAAYLLCIGSKEMGVTLPLIFLLHDTLENLYTGAHKPGRGTLKEGLGALVRVVRKHTYFYSIFLTGALTFTYYKVFISSPSHQKEYYGDSMGVTFLTVAKIIVHYIKLLLFPVRLVADYSYDAFPLATSLLDGPVLFSLTLLAGILIALFKLVTINRWVTFGGIWFFITLLPVCHIIPHHELLAEHYLYLPSYGFCLTAALFFTPLLENRRYALPVLPSLLCILLLFSVRTIDRNRDWKDGMTFWSKTVQSVPRCARAQNNLGVEFLQDKNYQQALAHLVTASQIEPTYAEAYNNMGLVYKELGEYDQAISLFTKAIYLHKGYYDAQYNLANTFENKGYYDRAIWLYKQLLKKKPRSAQVHNNLGIVYQKQDRLELAEQHFSTALTLDPANTEARNNLGVYFNSKGLYDQAIAEFKQILASSPDNAETAAVYANLGTAFSNKGMHDSAIEALREALRIKPDSLEAMNNLGTAYKDKGWYDQAIETFEKILAINPRLAIPHVNLAIVYLYQKKDSKKALHHLERAIAIDPEMPQKALIHKKIAELKQEKAASRRQDSGDGNQE